jgi:pilus assembly protein Flp/PilA
MTVGFFVIVKSLGNVFLRGRAQKSRSQAVFDGKTKMPMRNLFKRIASDISGATAVEYGLILALVFLAMLAAVQNFGRASTDMWGNVATKIGDATKP